MRASLLILTFFLTFQFTYSQESSTEKYIIKGKVIALLIATPTPVSESVIQLTGEKPEITETDEKGEFIFRNLKNGEYKLKIISEFGAIDTVLRIDNKSISEFSAMFFSSCDVNRKIAIEDLKNGKPRLLIYGGIAPIVYTNQNIFEEKYGIKYESYGCIASPFDCVLEYNQVIFDYLTDKFGKNWRKEVRKDVVGIKKK
jgi:hypothetical protein